MLSPVLSGGDKESKANPVDGGKSKEKEHKDPESSNGSTKVNPKGLKSDDLENPSTKEVVGEKSHEEKNEGKFVPHLAGNETCDGSTNRCSILETLTGCIQRLETGNFIALLVFFLFVLFFLNRYCFGRVIFCLQLFVWEKLQSLKSKFVSLCLCEHPTNKETQLKHRHKFYPI